jgi:hypothetical protein
MNSRRLMASLAEDCIGYEKNITFWIENCAGRYTQAGALCPLSDIS